MRNFAKALIVSAIAILVGGIVSLALIDTKVADGALVAGAVQPDYVVHVKADRNLGRGEVETHMGTGTVIRKDLILTANHVIRDIGPRKMDKDAINVHFKDGTVIKATIDKFDEEHDFVVLKLSTPTTVPPVAIAATVPVTGDLIRVGGFPSRTLVPAADGGYYEVEGKVSGFSSISRVAKRSEVFIVNATTFSGMSGAGAFNEANELTGVMWGSRARARVSDVDALREFLATTEYANEPAPVPDGVNVFGK